MHKPFKMWANTDEEAESILNYMKSLGGHWSNYGADSYSDKCYGGYFFDETGSMSYSDRCDEIFYDRHQYEEFNFATPVEIVEDGVEVDMVNNPKHYTSHPSGIECIEVTRHMGFNLGNATKYIWRCDLKKDAIEDLRKAIFYLNDEIELRLKQQEDNE